MDSKNSLDTPKKGKNRSSYYMIIGTIGFLFITFALLSLMASSDFISSVINITALVLMVGFILAGMGKIFFSTGTEQLLACTSDLEEVNSALKDLNEQQPGCGWQALQEQEAFTYACPALKEAIDQMNDEVDALSLDGTYSCDLANYVNEPLLESIGNAPFNDFVSNVMTGLGILGTFVGLAFGLRSFDTSTAEAMTSSIVPLIDGIKVAFYTSIFGVIYSLFYGTIYRKCMHDAKHALNALLETYYKGMGRHPENDVISRILSYQQSQTESMEQFAENISVALADTLGNVFTPALTSLPDQISQSMHQQLSPALDVMETNFNKLTGELSTQLSSAQEQGVEVLIEKFMVGMDKMLDGQVENLARSIETICSWQEKTIQHLDEAVSGICENAEMLQKINTDLENTTTHLDAFTEELKNFQEKSHQTMLETAESFTSSVQRVEQAGATLVDATTQSSEITASIQECIANITKQEQHLQTAVDAQMQLLGQGTKLLADQNENIKNTGNRLTSEFNQTSATMISAAKDLDAQLDNALSRSFAQFDSQLAKALQHFSGTLSELQNVVEGTPQLVDDVTDRMQKETVACIKTMTESQDEFTKSVKNDLSEISAQMRKSLAAITEQSNH